MIVTENLKMKVGRTMNWIESIKKYTAFNEQEKKIKKLLLNV
jgi:hypothetical protein